MDVTSYLLGKRKGGGETPTYQDKEVSITQNGEQTITADTGYEALSSVDLTINVPSGADLSEYFNSTIDAGTSSSNYTWNKIIKKMPMLTASGASLTYAFSKYGLVGCPIPDVDARNVTNFSECCDNISIDMKNMDFSNWLFPDKASSSINFAYFVAGVQNVETIDLSSLGELSTTEIILRYMFQGDYHLKTVDLSNLEYNGLNSINVQFMFDGCSSLEEIDMSKFDFTKTFNYEYMFRNVPTNCLIYVKDQTQKNWFTSNWSSLTNVQIK